MIITEPKMEILYVTTTTPLFSPKQCQMIIEAGREEPKKMHSVGMVKKVV